MQTPCSHLTRALPRIAILLLMVAPSPAMALDSGGRAPFLALTNLDGDSVVAVDPARPRPAALLFWAPWCRGCRKEIPRALPAILEAAGRGVPVFAVAMGSKTGDIGRFVEERAPGLPAYADRGGKTTEKLFSIREIPTLVLIEASGRVAYHGKLDSSRLAEQFEDLWSIAEQPDPSEKTGRKKP